MLCTSSSLLCSFHDVELQKDMPPLPPSDLSHLVVNRARRTVPYPLLGENTLVLSDCLCIAPDRNGQMCLSFRCKHVGKGWRGSHPKLQQ